MQKERKDPLFLLLRVIRNPQFFNTEGEKKSAILRAEARKKP